jgi:hypothetical protein
MKFGKKQALVSFPKTSNILMLFENPTRACFIQIAPETILLPIQINMR